MTIRSTAFYDAVQLASGRDEAAEARALAGAVRERSPAASTLLDVGAAAGAHAAAFAELGFDVRAVEADLALVALGRSRAAELRIDPAPLETLELGERFDAVTCLFGAAAAVRTPERLTALVARLAAHLAPGGVLALEPYAAKSEFRPGSLEAVFVDEPELKIARMSMAKQLGPLAIMDYNYLFATPTGVGREFERRELGLFAESAYAAAFVAAGLAPERVTLPPFARPLLFATAPR